VFDRPERGNAFNQDMLDELAEAFSRLARDEDARVVVLRGRGRHFCAGADLKDQAEQDASARHDLIDVLAALDGLPNPTIAVVQGGCIGGGAAFAACCDVVLACAESFFAIPEVRVGITPLGLAPLFIRAMGQRNFRRYGLSGEKISAREAVRIGLAHQVCDTAVLEQTLADLVDAFLLGAPGAMRDLKTAIGNHAMPSWSAIETAHKEEKHEFGRSPETIEGIASFREKRKPNWYRQ
jgi:methylglutaconyl-CoA hydratase